MPVTAAGDAGVPNSIPAEVQAAPQEYATYLDEKTGHQRLKGGALEIRDPTAEELAAAVAAGETPEKLGGAEFMDEHANADDLTAEEEAFMAAQQGEDGEE